MWHTALNLPTCGWLHYTLSHTMKCTGQIGSVMVSTNTSRKSSWSSAPFLATNARNPHYTSIPTGRLYWFKHCMDYCRTSLLSSLIFSITYLRSADDTYFCADRIWHQNTIQREEHKYNVAFPPTANSSYNFANAVDCEKKISKDVQASHRGEEHLHRWRDAP